MLSKWKSQSLNIEARGANTNRAAHQQFVPNQGQSDFLQTFLQPDQYVQANQVQPNAMVQGQMPLYPLAMGMGMGALYYTNGAAHQYFVPNQGQSDFLQTFMQPHHQCMCSRQPNAAKCSGVGTRASISSSNGCGDFLLFFCPWKSRLSLEVEGAYDKVCMIAKLIAKLVVPLNHLGIFCDSHEDLQRSWDAAITNGTIRAKVLGPYRTFSSWEWEILLMGKWVVGDLIPKNEDRFVLLENGGTKSRLAGNQT